MNTPTTSIERLPNRLVDGDVVADRFVVRHRVARGGEAYVYRAIDAETGAPAAIKICRRPNRSAARDVLREGALLSDLHCPGIPRCLTYGKLQEGFTYSATSWIDGPSLDAVCRSSAAISVPDALALAHRLLATLECIHAHNIIHRDVKPLNILLPVIDTGPSFADAMLVDFGVHQVLELSPTGRMTTMHGVTSGSGHYMAPEQFVGRAQTVATDLYGVGMILYRLLFNSVPGQEMSLDCIDMGPGLPQPFAGKFMFQRLTMDIVIPDEPKIPSHIASLVSDLLQRDQDRRPCSAAAARDRLQ